MTRTLLLLFLLSTGLTLQAQFKFSGVVNEAFIEAKSYLICVEDYKKSHVLQTEDILQESIIDSLGNFQFTGDFLSPENRLYKIYVDKCNANISNASHLLKQCEFSTSIIFIANNKDKIHFPLNDLSQMFCDVQFSREKNNAVQKIDSIQEELLGELQEAKNDTQRNIVFKNYFKKIQAFSRSFEEPLVELYTYNLYANSTSFSREFYLNHLKTSNYYTKLLKKLEDSYPTSSYGEQFKNDLIKDQYPLLISSNNYYKTGLYFLAFMLISSMALNVILFKKRKRKTAPIDYTSVLSVQEQKIFKLMQEKKSNKEIAAQLFISLSTVKTHINAIYNKLSIGSRKEIEVFFINK